MAPKIVFLLSGLDTYTYQMSSKYMHVVGAVKFCGGRYRVPNLKKIMQVDFDFEAGYFQLAPLSFIKNAFKEHF